MELFSDNAEVLRRLTEPEAAVQATAGYGAKREAECDEGQGADTKSRTAEALSSSRPS